MSKHHGKPPMTGAKPMSTKTQELTTKTAAQVPANAAPSYLASERAVGLEAAGREDYLIPRVQIAQALSPELKKSEPQYIEGLAQGNLFNTVTRENYGTELVVIPLQFSKSRIYFRQRAQGGGILCQSANGIDGGSVSPLCETCPKAQWGSSDDPKNKNGIACTTFMNYPSLILRKDAPPDLASVSLKSTGIKVAKRWNSLMRMRLGPTNQPVPIFSGLYKLQTIEEKNAQGTFYNLLVTAAGWAEEQQFQYAKQLYGQLAARGVRIDTSGLGGEEETVTPEGTEY